MDFAEVDVEGFRLVVGFLEELEDPNFGFFEVEGLEELGFLEELEDPNFGLLLEVEGREGGRLEGEGREELGRDDLDDDGRYELDDLPLLRGGFARLSTINEPRKAEQITKTAIFLNIVRLHSENKNSNKPNLSQKDWVFNR